MNHLLKVNLTKAPHLTEGLELNQLTTKLILGLNQDELL